MMLPRMAKQPGEGLLERLMHIPNVLSYYGTDTNNNAEIMALLEGILYYNSLSIDTFQI